MVKAFPGKVEDTADLLFRIRKTIKPEDFTALEAILKASQAALESLTQERGTTAATSSSEADELMVKARALADEKKISFSEAYSQVMTANPELVAAMRRRRSERDDE
jgi:hypothetical protein